MKRRVAGSVGTWGLFVVAFSLWGCAPEADRRAGFVGPMPPTDLRVEYREHPMGIDIAQPRLSWVVSDPRRSAMQTAYQVVVSTDPTFESADAVVWDSGKVTTDQSIHVRYGGPPLDSATRYYWTVRTWDNDDVPSDYAHTGVNQPSWWETGLLDPSEFTATWIGPQEESNDGPKLNWGAWIWATDKPEADRVSYFRLNVDLPNGKTVNNALLRLTADDEVAAYCNGRELGHHSDWHTVRTYKLTELLQPGDNVIAIRGENLGGPGAMIATLHIRLSDGTVIEKLSGKDWLTSTEQHANWIDVAFDDTAWQPASVIAQYGDDPWQQLPDKKPPRPSIYLRKGFEIDKPVQRARAYVTGLGVYRLHLNGKSVGRDVFTPGWTHYYKRVQYQTYDVTALLQQGDNAIGLLLGNGWWSGDYNWHKGDPYGDGGLRGFLQLRIEHPDGTVSNVVTDPTWTWHGSPIQRNTFYHGETYDAREEIPGWDTPRFDDSDWMGTQAIEVPADLLVAQRSEPIRVTEELKPMTISMPVEGTYIVDFGQNAAGRVRIKVSGPRGHKITLRFGEELDPEGQLYRRNYRSAQATDEYICNGDGVEVWEPAFTYRGFRYCEITNWPQADPNKPQPPEKDAVTMRVLHSAAPRIGRFECSHFLLNYIYENIVWGQRSNMHSVPTDCPQRDERLGWMGDVQTFGPTACLNVQMGPFLSKWLRDIDDSRSPEGAVTDVAPSRPGGSVARPGWGDAVVIVPWTLYQYYGDVGVLEENYAQMTGWVDYMTRQSKGDLYEVEGYGDWVPALHVKSPKKPIGSAYYYYSTKIVARTAEILGKAEDAKKYFAQAERTRQAFNAKHFDPQTKTYTGNTQTANILPLWFGITDEADREAVAANIAQDVIDHDYHLTTGFLGTAYIMPLLTKYGHHDVAWRLAVQTRQPSWGYMALNGATTVWELWDTDKQSPNMNSRNHFCYGVVGQWFYETIGGVQADPDQPGFKHIVIRPRPMGELLWARTLHRTLYGGIHSYWRRPYVGAPSIQLSIIVPANTTATVHVPVLGNTDPTVTEMGTVVYANGKPIDASDHIAFVERSADAVVFNIGSGTYAFSLTPGEKE